jgi:hypothetical protein
VKDDRVYLGHIRDAIDDIEEYASAGRDAFIAERMRQDAVIRKLEIIGEAAKQISKAMRERARRSGGSRSSACAIVSPMTNSVWISCWCGEWWSVICLC